VVSRSVLLAWPLHAQFFHQRSWQVHILSENVSKQANQRALSVRWVDVFIIYIVVADSASFFYDTKLNKKVLLFSLSSASSNDGWIFLFL
jgi:hypothetical protein